MEASKQASGEAEAQMKQAPRIVAGIGTVGNQVTGIIDVSQTAIDIWSPLLDKLQIFLRVSNTVSEVSLLALGTHACRTCKIDPSLCEDGLEYILRDPKGSCPR
jgi:hypothetical protein